MSICMTPMKSTAARRNSVDTVPYQAISEQIPNNLDSYSYSSKLAILQETRYFYFSFNKSAESKALAQNIKSTVYKNRNAEFSTFLPHCLESITPEKEQSVNDCFSLLREYCSNDQNKSRSLYKTIQKSIQDFEYKKDDFSYKNSLLNKNFIIRSLTCATIYAGVFGLYFLPAAPVVIPFLFVGTLLVATFLEVARVYTLKNNGAKPSSQYELAQTSDAARKALNLEDKEDFKLKMHQITVQFDKLLKENNSLTSSLSNNYEKHLLEDLKEYMNLQRIESMVAAKNLIINYLNNIKNNKILVQAIQSVIAPEQI